MVRVRHKSDHTTDEGTHSALTGGGGPPQDHREQETSAPGGGGAENREEKTIGQRPEVLANVSVVIRLSDPRLM